MKTIGILFLVALSVSAFNITDAEQFTKGLLIGITAGPLPDLTPCLGNVEGFGSDLVSAVKDFESKTASGVANGLREVASAIDNVVAAMKECKATVQEVEKLVAMLKNFKSPLSFAYHVGKNLIVNGVEIYDEIKGSIAAYHSDQYETMGQDIGEALSHVLLRDEEKIQTQIKEFQSEFLGLNKH